MEFLHPTGHIIIIINCLLLHSIVAYKATKNVKKLYKTSSIPIAALCENRLNAFTVSDNTRLVSTSTLIFEDITEEMCLKMCSDNRDNKGRNILCASFVYDHATFECTIYRSKSYPEDDLETEFAPGKRFFEKFCLAENVPADCANSQFVKAEQSVIIGFAKNVSVATSIEDCITQCLSEQFQCKSAMYFYKEGECITNTESAMTQPTSFAREESDKVIYIQNGCPAVLALQKKLEQSKTSDAKSELPMSDSDNAEDDIDEMGTTSSTAMISEENDNNSNSEEEQQHNDKEAITTSNLTTEKYTIKQDSKEETFDDNNYKEQNISSFMIDPSQSDLSELESGGTKTIAKISKALRRNVKKIRTEGVVINSSKHPKSLKQVRPSPFQTEEDTKSVAGIRGKAKAHGTEQKPVKRLNLETLGGYDEEDHFSQWTNWSPCKKPGERKVRRRKCYNLRKCIGALMEFEECPKMQSEHYHDHELRSKENKGFVPSHHIKSRKNYKTQIEDGAPPGILPGSKRPQSDNQSLGKVMEEIWSPWPGICQEFASEQPCKNHEIIGFESRDCLADDQSKCKGPFFRYCTIPC